MALALAVGISLRLLGLNRPLWLDEEGHIQAALAPDLASLLQQVSEHAAAAPLDYLLLRAYVWLTGASSVEALRLPYVFYGVATIWLIYLLGKRLFRPLVGILAALLLSTSMFHTYYSLEIRFYALSTLLAVLSALLFARAIQRQGWANWLAWGLVCLAGLYTHYFLLFVFSLQLAWLLGQEFFRPSTERSSPVKPIVMYLLACATFAPWYLSASSAGMSWQLQISIPFGTVLNTMTRGYGGALLILILCLPFGVMRRRYSGLLAMLAGLPFLGAYLLDNLAGYFFNPRQVIFSLPFLLLLTAAGVENTSLYAVGKIKQVFRRK